MLLWNFGLVDILRGLAGSFNIGEGSCICPSTILSSMLA
jgi:hypothetical protein